MTFFKKSCLSVNWGCDLCFESVTYIVRSCSSSFSMLFLNWFVQYELILCTKVSIQYSNKVRMNKREKED